MLKTAIKLGVLAYIGKIAYKLAGIVISGILATFLAAAVLGYFVLAVKSGWIVLE